MEAVGAIVGERGIEGDDGAIIDQEAERFILEIPIAEGEIENELGADIHFKGSGNAIDHKKQRQGSEPPYPQPAGALKPQKGTHRAHDHAPVHAKMDTDNDQHPVGRQCVNLPHQIIPLKAEKAEKRTGYHQAGYEQGKSCQKQAEIDNRHDQAAPVLHRLGKRCIPAPIKDRMRDQKGKESRPDDLMDQATKPVIGQRENEQPGCDAIKPEAQEQLSVQAIPSFVTKAAETRPSRAQRFAPRLKP